MSELPDEVYISWDVDGLDPTLCPNTGTPMYGGLLWREAKALIRAIRDCKTVVGIDLCEVAPGDVDARVGTELLYALISTTPQAMEASGNA
jgi:agmatinase